MMRKGKLLCLTIVLMLMFMDCASAQTNLMLYMIGGDLEEDSSAATDDILELLRSDRVDDVNIYVLAGGARTWSLDEAVDGDITEMSLAGGEIIVLRTHHGVTCGSGEALAGFLQLCCEYTPAEENILIIWGHGVPDEPGIGYDTIHEDEILTLEEIQTGITTSGIDIDILGFDACDMATERVASMMKDSCRHLLAITGETSIQGWPYQFIPSLLTGDPDVDTETICAKVNLSLRRRDDSIYLVILL